MDREAEIQFSIPVASAEMRFSIQFFARLQLCPWS